MQGLRRDATAADLCAIFLNTRRRLHPHTHLFNILGVALSCRCPTGIRSAIQTQAHYSTVCRFDVADGVAIFVTLEIFWI